MRRPAILLLWIAGILFPMAWLTRFSGIYSRLFERVFNPLWVHVLMHALLFAILAFLLAHRVRHWAAKRPGWHIIVGMLGLVLAVALLQEGIQLLYKDRPLGLGEALDVGIDLAGGSLGLVTSWRQ